MALFLLLIFAGNDSLITLKQFQTPQGDEYLSLPHASCYDARGRLLVVDPSQARVLIWNADGSFAKGFGSKGMGPGELMAPAQIALQGGKIYIWQENGRITRFDGEGRYEDNFTLSGPTPRRFAMLDDQHALLAVIGFEETGVYFSFEVRDRQNRVKSLMRSRSPGWRKLAKGGQKEEINTYMGDVDLQLDPKGGLWYGYGEEKRVHHMDAKGAHDSTIAFDLPSHLPSAEDRRHMEDKEVVASDGKRIRIKDLPHLVMHFDQACAAYTQFLVVGDKIALVLTSLGGAHHVGDGDARASYQVCSLKTGKVLARGQYELPTDSQVHYRNGRVTVFSSEDDGWEMREVKLAGM